MAKRAAARDALTMDPHTLLESIRALSPLLHASRDETEQRRNLAPTLVAALARANLFRLAVPRADGGLEAAPLDALAVFEELASVEAAAAWIIWNNTLPALMSRYLSAEVRHALFAGPNHVLANSTRPTGQAVRERDGFRVQGRWSLVSGCELADHILLRALVAAPAGAAGQPAEMIMAFLPKAVCQVVDTWQAGGLRGTGSHDVVVEGAWVAESHCVWFDRRPQLTAALYAMPFAATLSAGCASVCLGLASASLRALTELARTKLLTDRQAALRDQPRLLSELARMQASYASARLWLHHVVGAAFRACEAGDAVNIEQRAQIMQAAHHAAATSRQIVRSAYEHAGASALYTQCPLERAHRDVHAATQHVILQEFWLEDAGRVALGAAPLSPLFWA